jgi:hypothetical protein
VSVRAASGETLSSTARSDRWQPSSLRPGAQDNRAQIAVTFTSVCLRVADFHASSRRVNNTVELPALSGHRKVLAGGVIGPRSKTTNPLIGHLARCLKPSQRTIATLGSTRTHEPPASPRSNRAVQGDSCARSWCKAIAVELSRRSRQGSQTPLFGSPWMLRRRPGRSCRPSAYIVCSGDIVACGL